MKKPTRTEPLHDALPKAPTADEPRGGLSAVRIYARQSEASYHLRNIFGSSVQDEEATLMRPPYAQLFYNLEEMLAPIVHDGRNYMGPVKGYTSLIRAKAAPGSQEARWADRALESLESMEMHLNLLSIYRTRGISDVSETEWSEILDEVGAALRFFNKKNLPVRVKSDVRGKFFLRKELLKRGLVHILRNACESMKNGGTVSFFSCLQNGEELGRRACPSILVKVTDEGDGISDSRRSSIWKPFYTTKPNHFGLGLPYVLMVASLLDARIHLESREGFGTTVSLVIRPEGGEVETE